MGKKSGSGMNIPLNFSKSLEQFSGLKILTFFDEDPDPNPESV
jgi:hypothetical protein